ncbi:MAG: hypothetical protein ACREXY_09690 [Gammaproteobacteria bacterium]
MARVVWSAPAMCMVPTSRTVREDKYVTTAGRVKFDDGQAGRIAFVAAITTPLPEDSYQLVAHIVRAGPDLAGETIVLRRARRTDGAVDTVLECTDVQSQGVQNNVRSATSTFERFAIDLDTHYYWVQVNDVTETPQEVRSTLGVSLARRA